MNKVLKQEWEESERGWGCRPDGYSLHISEEDRVDFIKAYWDKMPAFAPSEYSRPYGTPFWIDVDDETFDKIKASKNGIRR